MGEQESTQGGTHMRAHESTHIGAYIREQTYGSTKEHKYESRHMGAHIII